MILYVGWIGFGLRWREVGIDPSDGLFDRAARFKLDALARQLLL